MAERRMFSKTIIDSDAFLDMPLSAQALYFHLSMRADDEGFINNPKKIQRMIGASDDDCKILVLKKFIIPFESGIVVVRHWKIHNYIQKDRFKPTMFSDERSQLEVDRFGAYSESPDTRCIQDVSKVDAQVRLGKDRIGKESKGEIEGKPDGERPAPYEQIKDLYNSICTSLPKCTAMSDARKKAVKARFASGYTLEDFKRLFEKTESSSFLKGGNAKNWRATFDWLVKDANMAKVLDGNYDDRDGSGAKPGVDRMQTRKKALVFEVSDDG